MENVEKTPVVKTVDVKKETNENLRTNLSPVFVEAEKMFEKLTEVTEETARNAYEFFLKRGGQFGNPLDDWFSAEARLLRPVAVEITETDGMINVSAAVPGFKPDEIKLSVKDDQLILSGETEKCEESKDENLVYTDWVSNRFFRHLTLPAAVLTENVEAELKEGILRLSLKKAVSEEPKRIAVKAG